MNINIILSETIKLLKVEELPQSLINDFREVGRWNNPDYYKKKNMGFYVRGIPKQITARKLSIEEDNSRTLTYERGLWSKIMEALNKYRNIGITLKIKKAEPENSDMCSYQGSCKPVERSTDKEMLR